MNIKTRDENDIKVVYLEGEMDTNTSPKVMSELDELRNSGVKKCCSTLRNLIL